MNAELNGRRVETLLMDIEAITDALPWWGELETWKVDKDLAERIVNAGRQVIRGLEELDLLLKHIPSLRQTNTAIPEN